MADTPSSVVRSSDNFYEFWCSPCSKSNKYTEGLHFCMDCQESLCKRCIKDHDKFDIMKNHRKVDIKEMDSFQTDSNFLPREMCAHHIGKVLDLFCVNHDTVVCGTCVALDHRSCKGVVYIPKAVHTYFNSSDVAKSIQESQNEKLKHEAMKNYKEAQIEQLLKDKIQILEKLEFIRGELKSKIDVIVEKTKTNTISMSEDLKKALDDDVKVIAEMLSNLNSNIRNLQNQDENIGQMFVYAKKNQEDVKTGKQVLEKMLETTRGRRLHFEINSMAENVLSLGTLGKTQLRGSNEICMFVEEEFSVKTNEDTKVCDINCSCFTANGELILADLTNHCLKRFDSTFRPVEICLLELQPVTICEVDTKQIAVSLGIIGSGQIQFVVLDQASMALTKSFEIDDICRGLYCNKKTLYVSLGGTQPNEGPGRICLYTLGGKILKTIERDSSGTLFLQRPRSIFVDSGMIYVCDKKKGVISLNVKEGIASNLTHPVLPSAYALCFTNKNELFVCGKSHVSVSLFRLSVPDVRLEKIVVLNTTKVNLQSMVIHPDGTRLLCFCENSNDCTVIKIK